MINFPIYTFFEGKIFKYFTNLTTLNTRQKFTASISARACFSVIVRV